MTGYDSGGAVIISVFYYFGKKYENVPTINWPATLKGGGAPKHTLPPTFSWGRGMAPAPFSYAVAITFYHFL